MKTLEAVRFLLELCLVAALAVAGAAAAWWLAIVLPVAFVLMWGWLIAPKSTRRLPDPGRIAVEIALFIVVSAVLAVSGHAVVGVGLGVASTGVAVALRATGSAA